MAERWHDADVRHRRELPPRPSCPAAWVFGPRRPSAADFDRWPAWLPRCRPTCRGASLAMSLGITTPNAPPISGAMPRRLARFRHHAAPRTGICGPPSARTAPRSALEHSSGTPRSTIHASARQPRVVRMRRRTVIDTGEARSVAAAAEGTPPAVHVCGHACCAWTFLYRSAGRDGRRAPKAFEK